MFIKLVRLGQDAELRYTPQGSPVVALNCAYSIGFGDKQRTQWIRASLWGSRSEKLVDHLKKGTQILLKADDLEVRQYTRQQDNTVGFSLEARAIDIEFAGGGKQDNQQGPAPDTNQGRTAQQTPQNGGDGQQPEGQGFDDFDDIPF